MAAHPHAGQPVLHLGEPLGAADAAMLLVHGRGASAADIMTIAEELMAPGWAYLAPQAQSGTWYPNRFTDPVESNEPWLSSALLVLTELVSQSEASVPASRMFLLGFSQGGCLTLEWVARNARRYAGVAGLSAGLIGPDTGPRDYSGSLAGTPVFLGCSDVDTHIPEARVTHAAAVLRALGAEATTRIYPGMGHNVNQDELEFVRGMTGADPSPAAAGQGDERAEP